MLNLSSLALLSLPGNCSHCRPLKSVTTHCYYIASLSASHRGHRIYMYSVPEILLRNNLSRFKNSFPSILQRKWQLENASLFDVSEVTHTGMAFHSVAEVNALQNQLIVNGLCLL